MDPHLTGWGAVYIVIALSAPMVAGLSAVLSIAALVLRPRAARVAWRASAVLWCLAHLMLFVTGVWALPPFFWMSFAATVLAFVSYPRVRAAIVPVVANIAARIVVPAAAKAGAGAFLLAGLAVFLMFQLSALSSLGVGLALIGAVLAAGAALFAIGVVLRGGDAKFALFLFSASAGYFVGLFVWIAILRVRTIQVI